MKVGVDLGVAHFISCCELDDDYTITYEELEHRYATHKSEPSVANFFKILSTAALIRNRRAVEVLCSVKTENFPLKGARKFDTQLVKIFSSDNSSVTDVEETISHAMDPSEVNSEVREYRQQILAPLWHVYKSIIEDNQQQYLSNFDTALQAHTRYFEPKGPNHLRGWMSFELMAAAALAHDRFGWKIPVESRITPSWMIEGRDL